MQIIPQGRFLFDIKSNIRIKHLETHLVQPYIAYCTNNLILQIWDYNLKYCLRAINISNIEPDKVSDVRSIRFHDNLILQRLFQDNSFPLPQSIMILTSDKLYSYHYLTDTSELITNSAIGVQNKCLEFLDSQYIAVGGEGVKIIDLKQNQVVKTMKGYHQKSINMMLSYKQNQYDRPRLVAGSQDGTLACWNADTALESPAFKFLMQKKGRQLLTANDGQELTSITYDPYDYQIVTVSEDYITVWSSLNGMEINRYKPIIPIKELIYFSQSSFPQTYIGHCKSSEVYALYLGNNKQFDYDLIIDLKNAQDIDKMIKITTIYANFYKNSQICIGTTHGLYIIEFNNIITKINTHYSFICPLSLNQSKDFVDDTSQCKKITNTMYDKLKQYEETRKQQQNILVLTTKGKNVYCHLIEFTQEFTNQREDWISMSRQCIQFTFTTNFKWDDSDIKISLSGRYIAIKNRNGYYVVLSINNSNLNRDMMGADIRESLHFLSQLEQVNCGMANSLAWHQYKEELLVIVPLNERNNTVQIDEKIESQSYGFFKVKTYSHFSYSYDSNVVNYQIQIFGFDHTKKNQMYLKQKITNIPKPEKVFGIGNYYFIQNSSEISNEPKVKNELKQLSLQCGQFYQFDGKQLLPVGQMVISPKDMKSTLNGNYILMIYETLFIIYVRKETGLEVLFTQYDSVCDSYYWEDVLFYTTDEAIKILIVVNNEIVVFTLAHIDPPSNQHQCCEFLRVNQYQIEYPTVQLKPAGQLKLLALHDSKLILMNQAFEISYIYIKHPFIESCLAMAVNDYTKCIELATKLESNTQKLIATLFINKNAQDQVQDLDLDLQLKSIYNKNIHERLTLELEYNLSETQITFDLLDQVMANVSSKEDYLNNLCLKLSLLHRDEELESAIIYGIQQQIFSQYSLTPLLSESQKSSYIDSLGLFIKQEEILDDQFELMLCNLYKIFQL